MSRAYLRANSKVTVDREPYVLQRQCADGVWVLHHEVTGRALELTTAQLFDGLASGIVAFARAVLHSINSRKPRQADAAPSIDVSPEEMTGAKKRLLYAKAAAGLPRSRAAIERSIDQTWAKTGHKFGPKPGWVSVYRWTDAYVESGATASLVVSHASKGNRNARYCKTVVDLCRDLIENTYLTEERPGVQHIVELAQALVRKENLLRTPCEALELPSRKLVQRLIDEIPAFDQYVARHGRDAALARFRTSVRHRITEGPLQRGEMDHVRMDVMVVDDETGVPLGRPWLTVLLDDFTRCVLGICLSFEPPSRATVARCLRHAFMPKANLREQYPDLKHDWQAFGVVSELVLDGGPEFHSAELELICFELDIEQHFSPRKTPWFKGKVEKFQGTLNRGVTVAMPGKTFEGIFDRDEYDPMKHAVVSMSGLRHTIFRWIVDVYHQKKHRALGCSPAQMCAQSIRPYDIPLLQDPLRFDAILGGSVNRTLTHKGIEYAGLLYNSAELGDLRRLLGHKIDVQIRIDRSNLGSVIVLHPERGTPCRVPCLRPEYAEGLTEWQHEVCKRFVRKRSDTEGDPDAWLDALLEISVIVESEVRLGKRKGATRERIARWKQGRAVAPTPVEVSVPKLQAADPLDHPPAPVPVTFAAPAVRKRLVPVFEQRSTPPEDDEVAGVGVAGGGHE